jgi:hypothetical protein
MDKKTLTVEKVDKHSQIPRFEAKKDIQEFWNTTQEILETAYFRTAQLYKSNLGEFSDLTPEDLKAAKEEIQHRLLDLANILHFAEHMGRGWVVYNHAKTGKLMFAPVPEKDRMKRPGSRKKVKDLVRVVDMVLNYDPPIDNSDDEDFVEFSI